MIGEWREINERFDAIKDHKPKAAKKLNELGEILASAYELDPERADEMWQYLVELNVSEEPANAKFYIAQVFNKLTGFLDPEDATTLLALTPERVQLMVLYGYDGGTLWHCLSTLVKGFLKLNNLDNCMITIGYFFEKFGGLYSGHDSLLSVAKNSISNAHELAKESDEHKEIEESFLRELASIDHEQIQAYAQIMLIKFGYDECDDIGELLDLTIEHKLPEEFMYFLWQRRSELSVETIIDKWLDYVNQMDDGDKLPQPNFYEEDEEDSDTYEGSKMDFFVTLMKNNDDLLQAYFNNASDLTRGLIYYWITAGDWERFTRYVAQILVNVPAENFEYSHAWRMLDNFLSVYFYSEYMDSTDNYGRSYKIINEKNIEQLKTALANISAITVGCPCHDEFHATVKNFMEKASGNIDALTEAGFDDVVDTRTAEEKFKDYVHKFLQSGQLVHDRRSSEYRRIEEAMREELRKAEDADGDSHVIHIDISGLVKKAVFERLLKEGKVTEAMRDEFIGTESSADEEKDEKVDKQLEYAYLHALDDEISEFYFLHCRGEYHRKAEMIRACILKDDVTRAVELVDLMLQTESYDDYAELNGWSAEARLVVTELVSRFDKTGLYDWQAEQATDEQLATAVQLIERIIVHLPGDEADTAKAALLKISRTDSDNDEYVNDILQQVEDYTTFPKPRGKGGAPNINRMSQNIHNSFELLARMGRLDVISKIIGRFAEVKDVLAPVSFDSWISHLVRSLSDEDFYKVYKMNHEVFEAWLEFKPRDWDITAVAGKLGKFCAHNEFIEFRDMVFAHYGAIDGIDDCFEFTSENTETQMLYDGDSITLKLDFVEVHQGHHHGERGVNYAEIHLLSTGKAEEIDSVRLLKCEVNGIEDPDCRCGWSDFDDDESAKGFSIYGYDEDDNDVTLYSDFFEKNPIRRIDTIVLQFAAYDEDGKVIETFSEMVIKFDAETGTYRVTEQAKHIQTMLELTPPDEEDDDDEEDTGITATLSLSFGSDDDDDADGDEEDEEEFEDITFFDNGDIRIDFCGVEFDSDDDTVKLKFWIDSNSDQDFNIYAKDLTINGELHETFSSIAEISSYDSDFYYLDISDVEDIEYFDIDSIHFSVEIDDEDNEALFETDFIKITCDTICETFEAQQLTNGNATAASISDDDEDDEDDEENTGTDEVSFEDITFYDENSVHMEFCGVIFEDETLSLKFWVNNMRDEEIKLFAMNVTVNGNQCSEFTNIASYEANEYAYCVMNISDSFGIDYDDIRTIDFYVEIDDDGCTRMFDAPEIHISCNPYAETFSVSIPGVTASNSSLVEEPTTTIASSTNDSDINEDDVNEFNRLFEAYKNISED